MRIKNFLKKTLAVILALAMIAPIMGNLEANVKEVKAASSDDSLNVKCQVTQGVVTETSIDKYRNNYVIRFVSAVKDYTDYKEIGFKLLEEGQTQEKKAVVKTVFKRIESTTGSTDTEKDTYTFSPKVVNTDAEYFLTAKLPVAPANKDVDYTVWAYGIKKDGTHVEGQKRCVSVNDGLKSCETINMSFENTKNVDLTGVTTLTANDNYSAFVIGVDGTTVHVRISGVDKSTLKSATKFKFKNDKGEEVGSEILRNLYTKYTGSGTADTSWFEEYYLADNNQKEYIIATSADLYGFAELANSASNKLGAKQNFDGKKIYMVSDIVVNEGKASDWATNAPAYSWSPIGQAGGTDFYGTFDGGMHTISGLYMQTTQKWSGLFYSIAASAVIKNLKLENSYFTSTKSRLGSIAGWFAGTLENVYSDALVVAQDGWIGGLIGHANAGTTLEKCWYAGTVTNTATGTGTFEVDDGRGTGGLIGYMNGAVELTNCLNSGDVDVQMLTASNISDSRAGGFVGFANAQLTITDSLNTGDVHVAAGKNGGYFVGLYKGNIISNTSYGYGKVSTLGNRADTSSKITIICNTHAEPHENTTGTFGCINVSLTNITGYAATTTLAGFDFKNTWSVVPEGSPILKGFGKDTCNISWYDESKDEFVLEDKKDFLGFLLLSKVKDFAEKTVRLGTDITLNTGNAADWATTPPQYTWEGISTEALGFAGTFDGGMHTISGVYMNTSTKNSGLFNATTSTAVIKNLKLENSYFKSTATRLGSIAGYGIGRFENVYSDATVVGSDSWIGGLIGQVGSTGATLEKCWYAGTVTNTANGTGTFNAGRGTGGLIGYMNGAVELTNCLNSGDVDVTMLTTSSATDTRAGGFVGDSAAQLTITGSLNTGDVLVASGKNGGYFVGFYQGNIISNTSYGYGKVSTLGNRADTNSKITITCNTHSEPHENTIGIFGCINVSLANITGYAATTNLAGFDFDNTWSVMPTGTPVLKGFGAESKVYDTSWYDESKPEYVLEDLKDFLGFVMLSYETGFPGKTIKLGNDIIINEGNAAEWATNPPRSNWTPIGSSSKVFNGTFDGNNYTISGVYMNTSTVGSGLFGETGSTAVIKNVKLTNSYFESTARELGSIVGRLRGKVYMVYSDAIMKSANTMYGGIAGITCGEDVVLENCWYDGSITTIENTKYAYGIGGIVGTATSEGMEEHQLTIRNCLNTANIDVTKYAVEYLAAGGIIGRAGEPENENRPNVEIDSCLNTGTITKSESSTKAFSPIVGYTDSTSRTMIHRTYATEAIDNAYAVDSTGIYVVDASAIQGSGAEVTMPLLGWGTDWKCGEEGKFPEIIFSTSGYGEGVTATQEEQEMLASYYADRVLYQGDIHGHAKTYGNGSVSAVYGDDGKVDLATWAQDIQNKTVDLDFAASLDHHQATHYDLTVWQENLNKFIYGTEAGTKITDLEDTGGLDGELHYNMLFPNKDALLNVLKHEDFSNKFQYGNASGIREDYFKYPNFTKEEMTNLVQVVRNQGGFFVHAHPTQSSYSRNTLDYYFADHAGFEVFYTPAEANENTHPNGAYGAPETLGHYRVWDELLKEGKRLYATAGSDTHGALNTYAVTSVYSDQAKADADKGEIINQLRDGDFVAGAVGMQMCIGDTVMGGTCDFDRQKLIVDINKFHSSVIKEGHRYRVDILNEKGVVLRQMVTPEQGLSIAMNVDANSKYYRVEVTDLTNKYLIAIGNPIWNAKFINAE